MPPPVAVTVTFEVPAGVEAVVFTVRVEEHAGLQEGVEKAPTAPAGNPETLNTTDWVVPETRAVVSELVTEDAATTDLFPELANEKLKVWMIVNEALASALALEPVLKALAFTVALLVRVIAVV
jgi:hypothetical protein